MRLDRHSLAPAAIVAAAGVWSMVGGALLWFFEGIDPIEDCGGDD